MNRPSSAPEEPGQDPTARTAVSAERGDDDLPPELRRRPSPLPFLALIFGGLIGAAIAMANHDVWLPYVPLPAVIIVSVVVAAGLYLLRHWMLQQKP